MELVKNCELVKAHIVDETRCEMKWYDSEGDRLLTVKFNRQSWDKNSGSFVDDEEKAAQCEAWAQEYIGCSFDEIPDTLGIVHDVYVYDRFNSLWEVEEVKRPKKFTEAIKKIIKTKIEEIYTDNVGIHVTYLYEGELYESKYGTSEWIEKMKKFVPDPDKEKKARKRFTDTFGVEVEDAQSLIGTEIQVQVKKAFSSDYGDILPIV